MIRASEGAGGQVVNAIVYQDELNTVRAELTALRKTADEKRCGPVIFRGARVEPVHKSSIIFAG